MALLFSLGFDRQFFFYVDMSHNQNQGNIQGDDKKKEKSPMTWHGIVCDGSEKKEGFEVVGVQSVEVEEEQEDMLFWSSTKRRCSRDRSGQPD